MATVDELMLERAEAAETRETALREVVRRFRVVTLWNIGDASNLLTQGEATQKRASAQRIYERSKAVIAAYPDEGKENQ